MLPKELCDKGRSDIEVSNDLRMAACVNDFHQAIKIMKVISYQINSKFWFLSLLHFFLTVYSYTISHHCFFQEKNIPYPVMIKASEGGGGKGIRQVRSEAEFEVNFRRVQVNHILMRIFF